MIHIVLRSVSEPEPPGSYLFTEAGAELIMLFSAPIPIPFKSKFTLIDLKKHFRFPLSNNSFAQVAAIMLPSNQKKKKIFEMVVMKS